MALIFKTSLWFGIIIQKSAFISLQIIRWQVPSKRKIKNCLPLFFFLLVSRKWQECTTRYSELVASFGRTIPIVYQVEKNSMIWSQKQAQEGSVLGHCISKVSVQLTTIITVVVFVFSVCADKCQKMLSHHTPNLTTEISFMLLWNHYHTHNRHHLRKSNLRMKRSLPLKWLPF